MMKRVTYGHEGTYGLSARMGILGLGVAALVLELKYIPKLKAKMQNIDLQDKVDEAYKNVDTTKNILGHEIEQIGELEIKTEEANTFVDLDDL